jgi:hypothetical protein
MIFKSVEQPTFMPSVISVAVKSESVEIGRAAVMPP